MKVWLGFMMLVSLSNCGRQSVSSTKEEGAASGGAATVAEDKESGALSLASATPQALAHLLDVPFSGSSGALNGRNGWIGPDTAIQLNGSGMAVLGNNSKGFVKHPLVLPENIESIRISARIKFAALPNSTMGNYSVNGTQPAWMALSFTGNSLATKGPAASALSVSVSSNGQNMSVGLGTVGEVTPAFGVGTTGGNSSCDLALDYNFTTGTATALVNGTQVLTGGVKLKPASFAWVGFQLQRIASTGGIDSLSVEWSQLPLGSAVNNETLRARNIESNIDAAALSLNETATLAALKKGWDSPPASYRPHTRWWWPDNAVTTTGIDYQLTEMHDKGFGGVEIMSFVGTSSTGSKKIDFSSNSSNDFVNMTKYAVEKARALGMEVTPALITGWGHGHESVTKYDGSKAMIYYEADVEGGTLNKPLSEFTKINGTSITGNTQNYTRQFDALIAVPLVKGTPDTQNSVDLTNNVYVGQGSIRVTPGFEWFTNSNNLQVRASLTAGKTWRLMSFWTALTEQKTTMGSDSSSTLVVDHLQKIAVDTYLQNAGGRFAKAIGVHYGQTVDSFFGDSFELEQDFSSWSTGLYDRFKSTDTKDTAAKGYDLKKYLPMLVYGGAGGADKTPYVRYDFGDFLNKVGMDSMVKPLAQYANDNKVGMRQQPHFGFMVDILQQSGVYQRPETEKTFTSFDPVFWHKLTTSGAWLYNKTAQRKWVSAEAFTYINNKYQSTMEQIKRATDLFLRDGVTQFYNHGYYYTENKELDPTQDLPWEGRISHVNTWWPWYKGLADYQARASFLSRQGRPKSNVLVYVPYPTLWSETVKYPGLNVHDPRLGQLPKILVASGYDFDFVNDELLKTATFKNKKIVINNFEYSVLVLPRAIVMPTDTITTISGFINAGGKVMALDSLPQRSGGMSTYNANDAANLATTRDAIFSNNTGGTKTVGANGGQTWFFSGFGGLDTWSKHMWAPEPLYKLSTGQQKFIDALKSQLTPDFEIVGKPLSDGLTFRHTVIGAVDAWFITNLSENVVSNTTVILNSTSKYPKIWNAMTGEIKSLDNSFSATDGSGRIAMPLDLQPSESVFILLTSSDTKPYSKTQKSSTQTNYDLTIEKTWAVSFQGLGNFSGSVSMPSLIDWSTDNSLKGFSGTALYTTLFNLPSTISLSDASKIVLDLGEVHEVAEVLVNGTSVGKVWMHPYQVEIAKYLLNSTGNTLEVKVANLLWNWAASQKLGGTSTQQSYNGNILIDRDIGLWNKFQALVIEQKNISATNTFLLPSGLIGPLKLISKGQ